MIRLMIVVYGNRNEKKTVLARKANMNYDTCVQYLKYLETIYFVKKNNENNHEIFEMTANGIKFCKKTLSDEFEENNST